MCSLPTYIRQALVQSMYLHGLWNMYLQAQEELPRINRTNNVVESWHRKMQLAVASHHPNVWTFSEVLKRKQGVTKLTLS